MAQRFVCWSRIHGSWPVSTLAHERHTVRCKSVWCHDHHTYSREKYCKLLRCTALRWASLRYSTLLCITLHCVALYCIQIICLVLMLETLYGNTPRYKAIVTVHACESAVCSYLVHRDRNLAGAAAAPPHSALEDRVISSAAPEHAVPRDSHPSRRVAFPVVEKCSVKKRRNVKRC